MSKRTGAPSVASIGDLRARAQVTKTAGDDFSRCYREQWPELVRFVMRLGADHETAADIAQHTFIEAYRWWPKIKNARPWLRKVASREYSHHMASHGGLCPFGSELTHGLFTAPLHLREEERMVLDALRRLPDRQREVMAWTFDGYSPREIASTLDIPAGAVRVNLWKARNALKADLPNLGLIEGGAR
jgi:RNA polymerase sigma-70 factor (ECF subfamily)